MINKLNLVTNIEKYHLGGIIESVKWNINNNRLNVSFISPNQDLVGALNCDIELEDGTIGIFNTSGLLKMLSILESNIIIGIERQYKVPTKLLIEDPNFSLQYSLADPFIIQTTPIVNEPSYDATFNIDSEFITYFSKAKGALGSNVKDIFRLTCLINNDGNKEVKLTLGDPTSHANKVEFTILAEFDILPSKSMSFNSSYMREILNANKSNIVEAKGKLSTEGMLKLEFVTEMADSIYYLPQIQI